MSWPDFIAGLGLGVILTLGCVRWYLTRARAKAEQTWHRRFFDGWRFEGAIMEKSLQAASGADPEHHRVEVALFKAAGPCATSDLCACRFLDGQFITDRRKIPPLHKDCHCYLLPVETGRAS